jgi:hypothetical protein
MVKKGERAGPRAGADQMSRKPANVRIAVPSFAERHFSRLAHHPLLLGATEPGDRKNSLSARLQAKALKVALFAATCCRPAIQGG